MASSKRFQSTEDSIEATRRHTDNDFDEVLQGLDEEGRRLDNSSQYVARPFNTITIGSGCFGSILAPHLLYAAQQRTGRTLWGTVEN